MREIRLSPRARKDLRRLGAAERGRIVVALRALASEAADLDVKALAGAGGWLRLRVGDHRVLYLPDEHDRVAKAQREKESAIELQDFGRAAELRRQQERLRTTQGYYIDRIVHRRDLDRAVAGLPPGGSRGSGVDQA